VIGNYYIYTERKLLHESDVVVLITEDFKPLMRQWRVDENKQHVIPNWATLADLPVRPKQNPWAYAYQLADKFCILYSGTLGMKHNPDLLLQLAINFKEDERIRIVVISEGLGVDWLARKKTELALDNLILLGFQPFSQLPDVLGSADILTAILEPEAGVYSVPSKVLTYLCAQRPLLLAVPPENLSAQIVGQNQAGVVVSPENVAGFVKAAENLIGDSVLRKKSADNARKYAETHFDITTIGDRFEQIILG
jgi:glycosyltransferase involved in cell wall biosynthesis